MGQKTHPKGFRLVTTQNHLSNWYSDKKMYPILIEEDTYIREKVEKELKDLLNISNIEIIRSTGVHLIINALYPREKDMYRKILKFSKEEKELEKKVEKEIATFKRSKGKLKAFASYVIKRKMRQIIRSLQKEKGKKISIGIRFLRNPFENAILIAKFIGDQLKRRMPYRRVVKQTIRKVKLTSISGIKIEISGRLNGVEMARSEWKREGKVPLHTLRANIDYTHQKAETIYGVMGIKVWLFKN
jgi:small subunit ribosomal protein S3